MGCLCWGSSGLGVGSLEAYYFRDQESRDGAAKICDSGEISLIRENSSPYDI